MKAYCQNCGQETEKGANFCKHCGQRLVAHEQRTNHMPWLRYLSIVLLVLAILPFPYGYYLMLRVVIFSIFGYYFFRFRKLCKASGKETLPWVWAIGGFALLFNPFMPAHLFRMLWAVLNLAGAYLIYKSLEWERQL